jgi:hypothetical protein
MTAERGEQRRRSHGPAADSDHARDQSVHDSRLLPRARWYSSGHGVQPRINRMQHFDLETLEAGLGEVRSSPKDAGRVELICRRPETEQREVIDEALLDQERGLVGDNWMTRGSKSTSDGSANPLMQLTLMNVRSASLIAGAPERRQLAGDQFFVDFDLSVDNLPPGSRLKLGEATIEITEIPHRGCGKFLSRFGVDALKFVNSEVGRELNLRGVNARIVEGGVVRAGDAIAKT